MKTSEEWKEEIKAYTHNRSLAFREIKEPWETITLYHGTTSKYLNDILQNGILPRMTHGNNNFSDHPSGERLVYLTTKWHYWYAYLANQNVLIEKVGESRFETESIEGLWNETGEFPIVITCEVPVELLTLDEDVVYQYNIKKRIRSGEIESPLDISVDECLAQGTVASLSAIELPYINEIVILGSESLRNELMDGQYGREYSEWASGFGMGELSEMTIMMYAADKHGKKTDSLPVYPLSSENPSVTKIFLEDDKLKVETI